MSAINPQPERDLTVLVLGGLQILDAEGSRIRYRALRAEILVAYLAITGRPQSRESLATLLWDDREHKQALANLRSLLAQIPAEMRPLLDVGRQAIGFAAEAKIWVDSQQFEHELTLGDHAATAIERYHGDFLAGVSLRDSIGLEEWILVERERLRLLAGETLQTQAWKDLRSRRYKAGIDKAWLLVRLDPLREASQRLLLQLLARDKQFNQAIAQYTSFRDLLEAELGVEPDAETRRLYQRVLAAKDRPPLKLPPSLTPFIGRTAELEAMSQMLDDPACHLLTLRGTGGAGKTRLSIQLAESRSNDYLDGVYFVPLASTDEAEHIPIQIAQALNFELQPKAAPLEQICDYLRNKEILLVLDNLEQLLPQASAIVARLIESAPDIHIVATSRQQVRLASERTVQVEGLRLETELGQDQEAIALFVSCARRVQPDFELDEQVLPVVREICGLVSGLPLGIELAATWLSVLTCAEIAAEIASSVQFLNSGDLDRPERQRSISAAFESSWRLLPAQEQAILVRLSVFRGGFDRQAASEIAGAGLFSLSSLLGKSLLYKFSDRGRFGMLEVLRQQADEKWESGHNRQDSLIAHSRYYAQHIGRWEGRSERDADGDAAIDREIYNIRRAWETERSSSQWSLDELTAFQRGAHALYHQKSWNLEGLALMEQIAEHIDGLNVEGELPAAQARLRAGVFGIHLGRFEDAQAGIRANLPVIREDAARLDLADALVHLGSVEQLLGNYEQARLCFEEGLDLFEAEGSEAGVVRVRRHMGMNANAVGEYVQAREHYEIAMAGVEQLEDPVVLAQLNNVLANTICELGDFEAAIPLYETSLAIYQKKGDRFRTGLVLNNIGTVNNVLGEHALARERFQECYSICADIGDDAGMAVALQNQGVTENYLGNSSSAKGLLRRSARLLRQISYPYMLALTLAELAKSNIRLEVFTEAAQNLNETLEISAEIQSRSLSIRALSVLALYHQGTGEKALAQTIAVFVNQDPAGNQEMRDAVHDVLVGNALSEEEKKTIETLDLDSVIEKARQGIAAAA
jgi:predicted ATPase/DNA-binding SARP family transcriptional activator